MIKLSIVPQKDFLRTFLNDCKFKSVQHFTLVGPNITTLKSQIDKTTSGMKLELESVDSGFVYEEARHEKIQGPFFRLTLSTPADKGILSRP